MNSTMDPMPPTLDDNALSVDVREESDGLDEEDEYDWVTDTEEDEPEYKCDACGTVIENTSDRFHCDTCSDYDLVRAISKTWPLFLPMDRGGKTASLKQGTVRVRV